MVFTTIFPAFTPLNVYAEVPGQGSVKIEQYNAIRDDGSNTIQVFMKLINTWTGDIDLSNIKIRYYYTNQNKPQTFWPDDCSVGTGNLTSSIIQTPTSTANIDHYLEMGFTAGAGNLIKDGFVHISFRITNNDWTSFAQSDDYSFNSTATGFTDWNKIPVLYAGNFILGSDPMDTTKPSVNITSSSTSPTKNNPVQVTFTFDEVVTGFDVGDVTVTNGNKGNFAGSGTTYTMDITPTGQGAITVNVAGGAAQDGAGNTSNAATQYSITYDSNAPTVQTYSPSDNSTEIAMNSNLVLTFTENILAAAGKNIVIYNSNDSVFQTIAANDVSKVSISGNTATISHNNFSADSGYYVLVDSGAFTDDASNTYTGIILKTVWNFQTVTTPALTTVTFSFDGVNPNKLVGSDTTMEYSLDGGTTWINCSSNTDLTSSLGSINANNDIKVRVKASGIYPSGNIQTINILASPAAPTYAIDYTNERTTVSVPSTDEYSTNSFATAGTSGTGTPVNIIPGTTYSFRTKATGTTLIGSIQTLAAPARPAAPSASLSQGTNAGTTKLTSVTGSMEYKVNSGAYTGTGGTTVDNISANKSDVISIRVAATAGSFVSAAQTSTVGYTDLKAAGAPVTTFSFSGVNVNKLMGSNTSMEYSLNNGATWTACTDNIDLTSVLGSVSANNDIKVRVAQTSTQPVGNIQTIDIIQSPVSPTYTIDYVNEKTTENIATTDEYSTDNFATAGISGTDAPIAINPGTTYYFRTKASGTTMVGSVQTLAAPARPATPTANLTLGTTAGTTKLGSVTSSMEYKLNGGLYIASGGTSVDNIVVNKNDTITVRVASAEGSFASLTQTLTVGYADIKPAGAPATTFSFSGINANKLMGSNTSMEYSLNNGASWTQCTDNADLTLSLTSITANNDIKVRVAQTASQPSGSIQTIDISSGPAAPTYAIDYANERTTGNVVSTDEYSTDNFVTAGTSGPGATIGITPGTTYYFRTKSTGTTLAGTIQSLTAPARPATPTALLLQGTNSGTTKLSSVTNSMEYKLNGEAYGAIGGTFVDNIAVNKNDTISVRIAATGSSFISLVQTLTVGYSDIKPGGAPAVTFSFDGGNANKLMGSNTSMEYSLDNGSIWSTSSDNTDLTAELGNITANNDIKVRVAQTSSQPAGVIQTIDIISGPAAPSYLIDYVNERTTANVVSTDEYSLNNFATAGTGGVGAPINITPGTTYYFRTKSTGTTLAGTIQTLIAVARPISPTAILAQGTTAGTTKLTNVTGSMEFKVNSGIYATTGGNIVDNISVNKNDTIGIRVAATGSTFSSLPQTLNVGYVDIKPAGAPSASLVQGTNVGTVKLISVSTAMEYEINGGGYNAVGGTEQDNIIAANGDVIHVRIKQTSNKPASDIQSITVTNGDIKPSGASLNQGSNIGTTMLVGVDDTQEYSINLGPYTAVPAAQTSVDNIPVNKSDILHVRVILAPGAITDINIAYNDIKPRNAPNAALANGTNPGTVKLASVDNTMEFSTDGGVNFQAIADTEVDNISADKDDQIFVRYTQTPTQPVSYSQTFTIGYGDIKPAEAPITTFSFNGPSANRLIGSVSGMEYSLNNGGVWTPCTDDIDLTAVLEDINDVNDIKIRVAQTSTQPAGSIQTINIQAAPDAPSYTIDYANELTSAGISISDEYSTDDFTTAGISGTGSPISIVPGTTYYFRGKAAGTTLAGSKQTIIAPARPLIPVGSLAEGTNSGTTQLTSVTVSMEYRLNGGNYGTTGGISVDNIPVNKSDTIQVRVAATVGSFRSLVQTLTVGYNDIKSVGPPAVSFSFDGVNPYKMIGANTTMEYSLDGGTSWTVCTDNIDIYGHKTDISFGNDIQIRAAQTLTQPSGDIQTINILQGPVEPSYTIEFINEETTGIVSALDEYSTDNFATSGISGTNTKIVIIPGTTYKFRTKATGTTLAGSIQTIAASARPATPTAVFGQGTNEGTIKLTSVDGTMEYKINGGNYGETGGNIVDNIPINKGDTIQIRVAATAGTFKSLVQSYSVGYADIKPSNDLPVSFSFNGINSYKLMGADTTMEYSLDGGGTWTGCTDNINISLLAASITAGNDIRVRKYQTSTQPAGNIQFVDINAGPGVTSYAIDYANELTTANIASTDEYSTNNFTTSGISGTGTKLSIVPGTTYYFRTKAVGTTLAGDVQTMAAPQRPALPLASISQGTNPGTAKLVSVNGSMEYKVNTGAYTPIAGNSVDNIAVNKDDTISIRVAATLTDFASLIQTLTIGYNDIKPTNAPVINFSFDGGNANKLIGSDGFMEYSLNSGITWTTCTDDMDISVETASITAGSDIKIRHAQTLTQPAGNIFTVDILQSPLAPSYAIDYLNEETTTNVAVTDEYSTNNFATSGISGTGVPVVLVPGTTYYFRTKATGTTLIGAKQTLVVPSRPETPNAAMTQGSTGGTIKLTSVSASMEYNVNNGGYLAILGTSVDNISVSDNDQVGVRIMSTGNSFKSITQTLVVGASDIRPIGPQDISLLNHSISENVAVGSLVGTLSTTGGDVGATFTYSLEPGVGSTNNDKFVVAGDEIRTNASFDYETKNTYSIRVRTTENGGLFIEKTFTINIIDVVEVIPPVIPPVQWPQPGGNTPVLSNNALLSNLLISVGTLTPGFKPENKAYSVHVEFKVSTINITPFADDKEAAIKVNGVDASYGNPVSVNLITGNNTVGIQVTAKDGATKETYNINIERAASNDADLKNLELVGSALSPEFQRNIYKYKSSVKSNVDLVRIIPYASDNESKITVNGIPVESSKISYAVGINEGNNSLVIQVTAQDGITQKIYIITVNRVLSPTPTSTRKPTPTPTKKATATPTKKATPTPTKKATPTPTKKATSTSKTSTKSTPNSDKKSSSDSSKPFFSSLDEIIDKNKLNYKPETGTFADVPPNYWANDYIDNLYQKGIVKGMDKVPNFKPTKPVTRAEFSQMLFNTLGISYNSEISTYTDVSENSWYYKPISALTKRGFIVGQPDKSFDPEKYITRQDMAVIISRILEYKNLADINSEKSINFIDYSEISAYAVKAVSASVKNNLMLGKTGNKFDPKGKTTRAEAAALLSRLLKLK